MYTHLIGKRSKKVLNTVERGAVKKFAEAIGDAHPIYINNEYGLQSRFKSNIAPPTFPVVFEYGKVEEAKLPKSGLIHGEQEFEYIRPLYIGEEVYCFTEYENYYEKEGGSGKLGFLVSRKYGEDDKGRQIFATRSVAIITEAVRKEMQNDRS